MKKISKKIQSLNVQHKKEASRYDQAKAWKDITSLTSVSVADIKWNWREKNVLDVATGTGRVAEYFKKKSRLVVGADISLDMLKIAQQERRLDVGVLAQAEKLPFLDSSFDLLYCRSALHYMDVPRALREWVRVVKDGGWIIVSDVSFDDESTNRWYARMLKVMLREMTLVPHQTIIRTLKGIGQERCNYTIHMVRGSLNDVLRRKHVGVQRADRIRHMLDTAPKSIKDVLKVSREGSDYVFNYGLTITRCHVRK